VVVYLVLYHMLVFTPFVTDPAARTALGYSCSAILCLHLFVHVVGILMENCKWMKFKIQLWFAMRRLN
jgi:hypothetical protein